MLRRRALWATSCWLGVPLIGSAVGPARAAVPHDASDAIDRARVRFAALAAQARLLAPDACLAFVNEAVNDAVRYTADDAGDAWATPLETLARGAGDCEDFAIAKFFLLEAAGWPARGRRLLYARRVLPQTPGLVERHVVALARVPFADPWVLDVTDWAVLPLSHRPDLAPVFSFDAHSLWRGVDPLEAALPLPGLTRWRDLLARRLRQER